MNKIAGTLLVFAFLYYITGCYVAHAECCPPCGTQPQQTKSEQHHQWCTEHFSKQLLGTNATSEQFDRAIEHCDMQWKVWERRDP